ncbi:LysR family transcriptional regulator [Paraburkholderia terricola]|jgi:DNA-binding transcriptional LysR family regulator|uniref:Transcriptional regulator, LysR family n=1 Tax=Paraburkholderia terricola TaxID=169427 RepID=A0A1M6VPF3_9BURK|nr:MULTISPECIES: LysR family transcriptional regulator [Paraburkholderia]SDP07482.1 transcriptional regulator, LysR family [Paraburkholderia sediminicola]SHK83368.1 transcriptional regulator, LysR family [Paraburkholderia terricola]
MDHLQAMRIFARVAQLRSFTKAAEQMQLPRPSVSGAIQYLETHLRVRLLQRTTRRVALTPEGAAYHERCMQVLADIDDAEALFADVAAGPRGVVRVDLPERLALHVVIPALPAFFARYPDIRVVLSATDRMIDLIEEGVDCAVRVGNLGDTTLVARRIGEFEQLNCASRGYIEKHGLPRTPADLTDHLAVGFFSSRSGRDLDWEYEEHGELKTLAMRSAVSVNSAHAYIGCCLAGLGLMQGPIGKGEAPLLESGELVEVLKDWKAPPLPVSVVFPHGRHLAPRVRIFVDWIAQLIAATTPTATAPARKRTRQTAK